MATRHNPSQVRRYAVALGSVIVLAVLAALANVSPAMAEGEFGIESFSAQATNVDGTLDTIAGSHPYQATVSFTFNHAETSEEQKGEYKKESSRYVLTGVPDGPLKDIRVDLPPGFIGNPQATAQCSQAAFQHSWAGEEMCPAASQVGVETLLVQDPTTLSSSAAPDGLQPGEELVPVYNLVPSNGHTAEFGFHPFAANGDPVLVVASLRNSQEGYSIKTEVSNLPTGTPTGVQIGPIHASLTLWGVPAEPSHTAQRGLACFNGGDPTSPHSSAYTVECDGGGELDNEPAVPFLTNPANCQSGALVTTLAVDSWEAPGVWREATSSSPQPTGCEALSFGPSLEVGPDETTRADQPSGYSVDLKVPQDETLGEAGLATPELRNATVVLPEGVSVSPGAAAGLQACSEAQIDLSSTEAGSCPAASQVATVKVTTPLLASPLSGAVFVGEPQCSPCTAADAQEGRVFRLFVEAQGSGVVVKLPGSVSANPTTGRLTATFDDNPQLPFSDLLLKFKSGPRAPLSNPQTCGVASTTSDLSPWSSPFTPDATPFSSFTVDWNKADGACPASLPFAPRFLAQTSTSAAGAYSPFTLAFSRADREQDLAGIQVHTPPGLLGRIAGIPHCGEAQANAGTCSLESRIGTVIATAGAGGHPYALPGEAYLTEGYKGAPFGLSIVVPAVAGPFNLGDVVVRASIAVNPTTAALTITSDPLPQIVDGVPIRLRTVDVEVNRPDFMFNATNCSAQAITATLTGEHPIGSSEAAKTSAVSTPYAASGCASLPFAPTLIASAKGKASRKDGASLDVKITSAGIGQANVAKVDLQLPKQLPSRDSTLEKACTEAVFNANPASCGPESVIGKATIDTPVLSSPLTGPAYLVSHGGAAFPDVEFVLQGEGVTLILDGKTEIKSGITYSRFESTPDAPFTSFEAELPTGPHSIFSADVPDSDHFSLCSSKLAMPTIITAQNGEQIKQTTKIKLTGCQGQEDQSKPKLTIKQAKFERGKLLVSVKTNGKGRLRISGPGLATTTKKGLNAGKHKIKVKLTNAGREEMAKDKKVKLRAVLSVGKQKASKTTSVKL